MAKFKRSDIENDERYSILPNDAVYDNVEKKIVGSLEGGTTTKITTSEQGREMALLKHDQRNERYATGFVKGVGLSAAAMPEDAWEMVGQKTAELIMAARSPRGFAELLNAAAKHMGYERPEQAQSDAGVATRVMAELAVGLVDLLKQAQSTPDRDIVDAESTEI